jgi:hypothetical protein
MGATEDPLLRIRTYQSVVTGREEGTSLLWHGHLWGVNWGGASPD